MQVTLCHSLLKLSPHLLNVEDDCREWRVSLNLGPVSTERWNVVHCPSEYRDQEQSTIGCPDPFPFPLSKILTMDFPNSEAAISVSGMTGRSKARSQLWKVQGSQVLPWFTAALPLLQHFPALLLETVPSLQQYLPVGGREEIPREREH